MLQNAAVLVDSVTLSSILTACNSLGAIWNGRVVHGHILEEDFDHDIIIMNNLIYMYSKTFCMEDAQAVFDQLRDRNSLSWGAIIYGYSEQGQGVRALELFEDMQLEGLQPSRAVFLSVLKACSTVGAIMTGREIHDQVIRLAFGLDVTIQSALVNMYAKCKSLDEAYAIFRGCKSLDIVMWGVMVAGFVENGQGQSAFELFKRMQALAVKSNAVIFISLLKACNTKHEIKQGMFIHEQIQISGLQCDMAIQGSLIDMYSNCGNLEKAREVFDQTLDRDDVIWVSMITTYIQHGHKDYARDLYAHMVDEGIRLNGKTFVSLLKVCNSDYSDLLWLIHDDIIRGRQEIDVVVGSALVDSYGRCGFMEEAYYLFVKLPERNIVSWGGLMAAYIQHGLELRALKLFDTMLEHGLEPDRAALSCTLQACCGTGNITRGKEIHDLIIKNSSEFDAVIISSLVHLYAECGSLREACKVFDGASAKDAVSWSVIIGGCCLNGNLKLAAQYLNAMEKLGVKPHKVIFTSMLTACSQAGSLREGYRIFKFMTEDYGIVPDESHLSCMLDLMGRTGGLNDAKELFQSIPFEYDHIIETSLLTGCRTYCTMEVGKLWFKKAFYG
ncbi:hypothetical protein KP509_35G008600 [Ceratopteris richardii]|nr:hypothetical protein KP509_35G008600 [Ceratopteris richardii]